MDVKSHFLILYSGGGLYDEEGNGLKIGEWIELSDEFEHRS